MQRFLSELQRRKVLRVASAYLVAGWIILQVALALQTAMTLAPSFSTAILALLVIGFPIMLVLTWFFEITPEGIKRTVAAGDGALIKPQTTDLILAGALALVVIVALVQAVIPRENALAPAATTAASGDKSIAVLPFANLSPDEDDAFFADGLTEEVLNILAQVRGIKVTSRTSSFAFKGKELPVPEIAKLLSVRHILEGSVRRKGDDIRITAQLIDVATDAHIWSKTFERNLSDVFAVQDDIAREIAGALNIELSLSAGPRGAPTQNLEAYRLYLKAREQASLLTKDTMTGGIDLFKQAIKLDPNFAEAYAHMASLYQGLRTFDPAHGIEISAKAQEAAETALKLKPNLATAYAVLSSLALRRLDWEAAFDNAKKALELEPSNPSALAMLGQSWVALGSFGKARQAFEEVARVDPLFGLAALRLLSVASAEGDNAAAEKLAVKLQSSKGLAAFFANVMLALIAQEKGDHKDAAKFLRLVVAPFPQNSAVVEPLVRALKDPAWRPQAITVLRNEAARDPTFDPETYYLLINAPDALLDSLKERLNPSSKTRGSAFVMFVWRLIARGEGANPKVRALLRDTGLVDYWKKHGWPDRCRAKGEDDFECS